MGEAGVLKYMPDALFLRPRIVFRARRGLTSFNVFAGMTADQPCDIPAWVRIQVVSARFMSDDVRPCGQSWRGDGQGPGG